MLVLLRESCIGLLVVSVGSATAHGVATPCILNQPPTPSSPSRPLSALHMVLVCALPCPDYSDLNGGLDRWAGGGGGSAVSSGGLFGACLAPC